MDDLKLWRQLKNGEHRALKDIYDLHIYNLENYARKFTSDGTLIEDTIHDIFVNIWQKRETLGDTDSIIKYLCVTLRRELIRRISKAQKLTGLEYVENMETDFSLSIEDAIMNDEVSAKNSEKLKVAMTKLSGRQKEAIYLRYYEEMEYEEICTIMDINYQSVRNLISKGIIELRNHFTIFITVLIFLTS